MNTQTKAVLATTALVAAVSAGVYTSDFFASAPIGGTYQVDVTLDPLVIANPGTTECTMDFAGSPAVPAKASCTARSSVADEWESCSSTTPVGNVFTCTLKFESIYRPTGTSFTEGDWIINHISAFAADGTTRLIAYHDALQADGQDVDFILGPCTPTTCVAEGWDCGAPDDGCGTPLDCGEEDCGDGPGGYICGLSVNYVCDCDGQNCGALGYECGAPDDNCGDPLDCDTETGGCGVGDVCSDAPDYQCEAGTGGTGGTAGTGGTGGDACAGYVADYSVTAGTGVGAWDTTTRDAGAEATELVDFDFYIKTDSDGTQQALFSMADVTPIEDYATGAIMIRFNGSGKMDAIVSGTTYGCDGGSANCPSYEAGTWYHFVVNANLATSTYSVDWESCDTPGLADLVTNASFRSTSCGGDGVCPKLEFYNIWAWDGATTDFDLDTFTWTPSGCVPDTCASYECGSPSDGCGGVLSCGTCPTGGDVCYPEGTCCTPSATVCTDPDPDYECGDWPDGCGGSVNCDTGGLTCNERVSGDVCNGSGQCVEGAAAGEPYVHVTPADVGVSIGPGVIAAYPTITYSGSCAITTPGTTIENRIINCSSLNVYADNVTVRNSVLNLTGSTIGVRIGDVSGGTATGLTIEYSHVNYQGPGKIVIAYNDAGDNGDYRNITLRKNDIEGGHDFFYLEGDLDGMVVEDNVLGPLGCTPGSDPHADAFQLGAVNPAHGAIVIRGNYFDSTGSCTKTAIYYMATGDVAATIESNLLTTWGAFTLWPSDVDTAQIRYNLYDSVFEAQVGNRCGCSAGDTTPCCSYPAKAAEFNVMGAPSSSYVCNRYESDGDFIEQQYVTCEGGSQCVTHETSGCPSYTP